MPDLLALPVDPDSARALAAQGLRLQLVDPADGGAAREWRRAVVRGFLDPEPTEEEHAEALPDFPGRRTIGVYDDSLAEPGRPVATIDTWEAPLSLPGGDVRAAAISAVTVAPTHRRRGIATSTVGGELRAAAAAGLPVAAITVSEATIYDRFGFGPAAWAAELLIDSRRLAWTGPHAAGRVQLVSRDGMLADAPAVFDRARVRTPGGIGLSGLLLTRLFGRESDPADLRAHRFARYDDADGVPQGYVSYTAAESPTDFAASTLTVHHLAAATDEAEAALWRFLIEMDLIGEISARLRPVDERLPWLVDDRRAVRTVAVTDHLWLRVLDPVAALTARTYAGPGAAVLDVADPAGFAAGRWLLEVDEAGAATVRPAPDPSGSVPEVALGAAALARR
ncbi:GNAT family N-acetyltransferase, partial [Amnibacterium sp.]|uniref:GNAT family N-acetyltransferase n=1 Tax=Amnibacterium sp. TaxID=1872496 RepID=UPI00260BF8C6